MLLFVILILFFLVIWGINLFSEKRLKEFNLIVRKITEDFSFEEEKEKILNITKKYKFNDEVLRNINNKIKEVEKERYSKDRARDVWKEIQKIDILKKEKKERKESKIYE